MSNQKSIARFELWHQGPPYEAWGVSRIDRDNEMSRSTRGFGNDLLAALDYFAELLCDRGRCAECGDLRFGEWQASTQQAVDEQGVCFTCWFWRERVKEHGPNVAIVNGHRYTISPDPPRGYQGFVGHGGAEFCIQFHDGRKVVSHNLWAQGRIPRHFHDRLPNNAAFVRRGHKSIGAFAGYGGPGSADADCEMEEA